MMKRVTVFEAAWGIQARRIAVDHQSTDDPIEELRLRAAEGLQRLYPEACFGTPYIVLVAPLSEV